MHLAVGGVQQYSQRIPKFNSRIDLEGRTLTDFVVSSATEKAIRTIEEHTIIKLSRKDSLAFVESLLNPPDPHPRMLKAALKYKQSIGLE